MTLTEGGSIAHLKLPRMVKSIQSKNSIGNGVSMNNNTEFNWYIRMSANSLLVKPKVKLLPKLHEEDDNILDPISPVKDK